MLGLFEFLCVFVVLGILIYRYLTRNWNFWVDRKISGPKPEIIFGNARDVFRGKFSLGQYLKLFYDEYKQEGMFGIFMGNKPTLVICNPEFIKTVLIKEFSKFADRGIPVNEKQDPLGVNLFSIDAERWRILRPKLAPIFTTGKLKDMCAMIAECSEHLEDYLETLVAKGEIINIRDVTARFTIDVIGTCAFGIDMKALADEDSEFRKIGNMIFNTNSKRIMRRKIAQFFPLLARALNFWFKDSTVGDFFMNLTIGTMEYRKKHNIIRNDFIKILMELRDNPESFGNIKLTDNLLVAQAVVFFAAGFETSATTITNALYELALNPDIQEKLREEIVIQLKKYDGDLRYENIKEMQYLDKVFRETLRKYPPATTLMRESLRSYTFEDTDFSIPEKQAILIPIYGIHHDPDVYPKPEVFDPERFTAEEVAKRHPMNYLPFGDGPRNCIGARFAIYQTKIGLLKMVRSYKVEVCGQTEYELDPQALVLAPKGELFLKFIKITENKV